jgi:hypothetical protein
MAKERIIQWFHFAVVLPGGEVLSSGRVLPGPAADLTRRSAAEPPAVVHEIPQELYEEMKAGRPFRLTEAGEWERWAPPVDLARLRAEAIAAIDLAAERSRAPFVTHGAGQVMEYQATLAEAQRFDDALEPHFFPWLQAEVEAQAEAGRSVELGEVAAMVLRRASAWEVAGTEIKRLRRAAKLRVAQATTPEEIAAAAAAIPWPQPS